MNNMIKKLNERGDVSESRLTELEESLKRDVQSSVVEKMEKRVKILEDGFNKNLKAAVKKSSSAWMIPFVIVIVVIGVIAVVVYVGLGSLVHRRVNIEQLRKHTFYNSRVNCLVFV